MNRVQLTHGINTIRLDLARHTVADVRLSLADLLNIGPKTPAYVGTNRVLDHYVLRPGDQIEFMRLSGCKGGGREIKVWGNGRNGLWSFGETVDVPDDYEEVPTGEAFITRRVKQLAETVYVRMRRSRKGGYSKAISILAPRSVIEQVIEEAKQSEQSRLKNRKYANAHRTKREKKSQGLMKAKMTQMFPAMPEEEADEIIEHAFQVGSGRVGRTTMISEEEKITLAVIARIRHYHTKYDEMLDSGWDRELAREEIRPQVGWILEEWRQPKGDQDGCDE